MLYYKDILEKNKKWAAEKLASNPEYFSEMSKGQHPPLLWLGCADSRVPSSEIIGAEPGEVFTHRNIANMAIHTDINMLSVLEYAVNALKVRHIIVCGHYGCGGVKAAMGNSTVGFVGKWIRHIKDIYAKYREELEAIDDENKRWDRLVELNVKEQVADLAKTSIVQNAWKEGQFLHLHGWVYDIKTGIANDMEISMNDVTQLDDIYHIRPD
ncbi:carbonic anhydrase [Allomuricauda sp. SCSIO 65647]|uniref:carbonic anhydrase n=1 Tax=Allomuricauda sp. SCSIO 65647 TaxID=2908843 RepID=UPI001F1C18EC|nr:carbonic anhydrase [Muricauda sp. SCSIO 65647]UJH66015.1 carbonic anhydrase [Muricauda sp. SCSIO 65647]